MEKQAQKQAEALNANLDSDFIHQDDLEHLPSSLGLRLMPSIPTQLGWLLLTICVNLVRLLSFY